MGVKRIEKDRYKLESRKNRPYFVHSLRDEEVVRRDLISAIGILGGRISDLIPGDDLDAFLETKRHMEAPNKRGNANFDRTHLHENEKYLWLAYNHKRSQGMKTIQFHPIFSVDKPANGYKTYFTITNLHQNLIVKSNTCPPIYKQTPFPFFPFPNKKAS